ncbi:MAG: hypothetical protein ACOCU4_10450, partial [Alkalispirochaeta sp.]
MPQGVLMVRLGYASLLIVMVVATALVSRLPAQQQSSVSTASVESRSHIISVAGRLRPLSRIEHSVPSTGFVDEIMVTEGSMVESGDTLLTVRRRDDA